MTAADDYDAEADFAGSLLVAYAAVRERMARGGPPWGSACFIVFACSPERHAHVSAKIGVHSAADAVDDTKGRERVLSFATNTMMARIAMQCGAPPNVV